MDFARLKAVDEAEIKAFATSWGLVGYSRPKDNPQDDRRRPSMPDESDYDPLDWIRAHALGIDTCLRIWAGLQADGAAVLAPHLMSLASTPVDTPAADSPEPGLVLRFSHGVLRSQVIGQQQAAGSWADVGRAVIEKIVKPNLAGFRLALIPASEQAVGQSFELRFAASTLLEIIYWQLARIVAGYIDADDIRHCDECGNLFLRTYPTQRFCPSDPFTEKHRQSRCGKRARMREFRRRPSQGERAQLDYAIASTQGVIGQRQPGKKKQ